MKRLRLATLTICVALTAVLGVANMAAASKQYLAETWYDVDKVGGDSNMCWIAAAANVLAATGWGKDYGSDADGIYAYFLAHWTNTTGYASYAWEWWLNGVWGYGSTVNKSPAGGNFWPNYSFDDYSHFKDLFSNPNFNAFETIVSYLDSGYGVVISVYGAISHSLTVWGYEYDSSDAGLIYVTDSDDGVDLLYTINLTEIDGLWHLQGWTYGDCTIGAVEALAPLTLASSPVPTPAPNSILSLLSGLVGVWMLRKRGLGYSL